MKKLIITILIIPFIFCACTYSVNNEVETTVQPFINAQIEEVQYIKSVWITYYELHSLIGDKNEEEFTKAVNKAFNELKDMGFNTVTVQVRAFADAFYNSSFFPLSKYCFGEQGGEMKYDVLKVLCSCAQNCNMRIEAWVNPYRVSFDENDYLSEGNIAKKWLDSNSTNVYSSKDGLYFNPASKEVKQLIINGVKELAENYSINAIHFDDYFYPAKDKNIDKTEYKKYKKKGGKLSLSDYRRENVSDMIKKVYMAIKEVNKNVRFGISPAANIENNYNNLYADTQKWAREDGYCDYICPQVYFGFKNVNQPFMFTVKKWVGIAEKDLYIGLPLYKAGKKDEYASSENKEAINEFKNNKNIIARQINYLAKIDDIKGFYVFSYSSLFDEKNKEEVENMIKAIQGTNPNQHHSP